MRENFDFDLLFSKQGQEYLEMLCTEIGLPKEAITIEEVAVVWKVSENLVETRPEFKGMETSKLARAVLATNTLLKKLKIDELI